MKRVKLARVSVCPCGHSALAELKLEVLKNYLVDPGRTESHNWKCLACNREQLLTGIWVAAPHHPMQGIYAPLVMFDFDEGYDMAFAA